MTLLRGAVSASLLSCLLFASGCHSHQIEATVENHTGAAIEQLEVDYPTASFGANSLAADASFGYRFQIRGSGAVKVQYSVAGGQTRQITGPSLSEGQQGRLVIVLLPDGKAEFQPELTAGS